MSYILDALRKADAQRSRDPVRGIHAQPLGAGSSLGAPPSRMKTWGIGAACVGVAAVGAAGWYVSRDRAAATAASVPASASLAVASPPAAPVVIAATPATSVTPVVGTAVLPLPAAPAPAPRPVKVAQAQTAPPPGWPPTGMDPRNASQPMVRGRQPGAPGMPPPGLPAGAMPQPGLPAGVMPQPTLQPPGNAAPPAMPTTPPPTTGMPPPPPPPVAANAPPPPPVAGLPPDAPKLSISGGVYSANRKQRMLIINGEVFNEGSEVTAGLFIEEIKPKVAVLRYRGARYTVGF